VYGIMGVRKSLFSVDGKFDIHSCFANCYVQIVSSVVLFYFLGKLHVWMDGVEIVGY